MPPRRTAAAANPDAGVPPNEAAVERIDPTVEQLPEPVNSRESYEENSGSTVDMVRTYFAQQEQEQQQQQQQHQSQEIDQPGPSTTYIPPQQINDENMELDESQHNPGPSEAAAPRIRTPSPPLPDLRSRAFPPNLGNEEDSDDDDDEVIAKLPIYLSSTLFPNISLFQYPLRTTSLKVPEYAIGRNKVITSRVKESTGRIEVEIPVDEDQSVWRREKAEDLGFVNSMKDDHDVVGGFGYGGRGNEKEKEKDKKKSKKGEKIKDEQWGDKMRLRSDVIPNATGYYSGVIKDGALHLHPVNKIQQFRTSLKYLDDVKVKNDRRAGKVDADIEDRSKEMIGGKLRKYIDEDNDGSGSIRDFREKMWQMAREEDNDPWVEYKWRSGHDNKYVEAASANLLVSEDKRGRLECSTRPLDYLDRQ